MKSIWQSVTNGRRKTALYLIGSAFVVLIGFQNCSNVNFDPVPETSLSSLAPKGDYDANGKPTAAMTLNDGSQYSKDLTVRATIESAKATEMLLKNEVCPDEKEVNGWVAFEAKSNFNLSNNDGQKRVYARVRDAKKIVSECFNADIYLDQTAPVIQTLQSTDKFSTKRDSLFLFDASDAGSGVDKFFCRITGQNTYAVCQPRVEMRGLSDGSKTLNVYAVDKAGNQSIPTDFSWMIDTVAPTVQIIAPFVPALVTQQSAAVHFSGQDVGSGVDRFECSLDGQVIASCSSPQTLTNLSNGNHSFSVVAFDKAGLASQAATHNFAVDATASDDFQILGLAGGTDVKIDPYLTANVNPVLHWGASNGAQSYRIQIYNQARTQMLCQFNNVAANLTSQNLGACGGWANNTKYSISMSAFKNGIEKTAPNLLVTVDYSGPTITITKITKEDDLKRATLEFTVTDASGVASTTCIKIFGGDMKQDNCLGKTSLQYTNLLEGKHDFSITAADSLGNTSQSQNVSFVMDYVVCDPFRMIEGQCQKGLKANLYYASAAERELGGNDIALKTQELRKIYPTSVAMITKGKKSNAVLYLPSLDVRTREFKEGFVTTAQNKLKDDAGNLLEEWFGLDINTIFKLGANDQAGYYQLIILSDDGSNVYLNNQLAINSDGLHSTRVGCMNAGKAMDFTNKDTRISGRIQYFQGPRTQISLSLFWRRVSSPQAANSQYCGSEGEDHWGFGKAQHYQMLMNEGFKPLTPENFITNEATNL